MSRSLGDKLRTWYPSQRPRWAMMPRSNASLLVDTVLTAVSVLERAGVAYTMHQGSLLGAVRLGGVLPWDVDADLAILDEDADSARRKLEHELAAHGLALEFSEPHYYYTIRPFAEVHVPGLGARRVSLVPLVEVILATQTIDPATGEPWIDRHSLHRMFAPGELLPLRRYPWHASFVLGPAHAEPVLDRLYGAAGSAEVFARLGAAALDEETAAFWRRARPLDGAPDFDAIRARAIARHRHWSRVLRGAPWYVANGLYNSLTEWTRRALGGR